MRYGGRGGGMQGGGHPQQQNRGGGQLRNHGGRDDSGGSGGGVYNPNKYASGGGGGVGQDRPQHQSPANASGRPAPGNPNNAEASSSSDASRWAAVRSPGGGWRNGPPSSLSPVPNAATASEVNTHSSNSTPNPYEQRLHMMVMSSSSTAAAGAPLPPSPVIGGNSVAGSGSNGAGFPPPPGLTNPSSSSSSSASFPPGFGVPSVPAPPGLGSASSATASALPPGFGAPSSTSAFGSNDDSSGLGLGGFGFNSSDMNDAMARAQQFGALGSFGGTSSGPSSNSGGAGSGLGFVGLVMQSPQPTSLPSLPSVYDVAPSASAAAGLTHSSTTGNLSPGTDGRRRLFDSLREGRSLSHHDELAAADVTMLQSALDAASGSAQNFSNGSDGDGLEQHKQIFRADSRPFEASGRFLQQQAGDSSANDLQQLLQAAKDNSTAFTSASLSYAMLQMTVQSSFASGQGLSSETITEQARVNDVGEAHVELLRRIAALEGGEELLYQAGLWAKGTPIVWPLPAMMMGGQAAAAAATVDYDQQQQQQLDGADAASSAGADTAWSNYRLQQQQQQQQQQQWPHQQFQQQQQQQPQGLGQQGGGAGGGGAGPYAGDRFNYLYFGIPGAQIYERVKWFADKEKANNAKGRQQHDRRRGKERDRDITDVDQQFAEVSSSPQRLAAVMGIAGGPRSISSKPRKAPLPPSAYYPPAPQTAAASVGSFPAAASSCSGSSSSSGGGGGGEEEEEGAAASPSSSAAADAPASATTGSSDRAASSGLTKALEAALAASRKKAEDEASARSAAEAALRASKARAAELEAELVQLQKKAESLEGDLVELRMARTAAALSGASAPERLAKLADDLAAEIRTWLLTSLRLPGSDDELSLLDHLDDEVHALFVDGCGIEKGELRSDGGRQLVRRVILCWLLVLVRGSIAAGHHLYWLREAGAAASLAGLFTEVRALAIVGAEPSVERYTDSRLLVPSPSSLPGIDGMTASSAGDSAPAASAVASESAASSGSSPLTSLSPGITSLLSAIESSTAFQLMMRGALQGAILQAPATQARFFAVASHFMAYGEQLLPALVRRAAQLLQRRSATGGSGGDDSGRASGQRSLELNAALWGSKHFGALKQQVIASALQLGFRTALEHREGLGVIVYSPNLPLLSADGAFLSTPPPPQLPPLSTSSSSSAVTSSSSAASSGLPAPASSLPPQANNTSGSSTAAVSAAGTSLSDDSGEAVAAVDSSSVAVPAAASEAIVASEADQVARSALAELGLELTSVSLLATVQSALAAAAVASAPSLSGAANSAAGCVNNISDNSGRGAIEASSSVVRNPGTASEATVRLLLDAVASPPVPPSQPWIAAASSATSSSSSSSLGAAASSSSTAPLESPAAASTSASAPADYNALSWVSADDQIFGRPTRGKSPPVPVLALGIRVFKLSPAAVAAGAASPTAAVGGTSAGASTSSAAVAAAGAATGTATVRAALVVMSPDASTI